MSDDGGGDQAAEIESLRTKLALLQQIQTLQAQTGLAPNVPDDHQLQRHAAVPTPKNVKPPEGRYNMSLSEYRTYAKDCVDYKTLTRYTDEQLVLQMRLNMDSDLKQAVDTNYPNWREKTVEDAIHAVGEIVNQISNCAVYRSAFYDMTQAEDEKIREFSTRLRSCAADCSFMCPYDETHDLTDYQIIDRVRTGVSDIRLKQELLQKQATLTTLPLIIQYCEDFESAKRDNEILKGKTVGAVAKPFQPELQCVSKEEIVAALSEYRGSTKNVFSVPDHPELQNISQDEVVAALSAYRQSKKQGGSKGNKECNKCGYAHPPKGKCPARDQLCLKCGKTGHFSQVCRSGAQGKAGQQLSAAVIISAVVAGTRRSADTLARLPILVGYRSVKTPMTIDVIPDTGAEVTVAGDCHMNLLGIKLKHLVPPTSELQHVAGGQIQVIGCCKLSLSCGDMSIVETIFFIANVPNVFLSLGALKKFNIVHENFPQPMRTIAATKVGLHDATHGMVEPPFAPVDENISLLKQWLIDEFKKDVFNGDRVPFPSMKGKDLHIHLIDKDAPAYAVHTPTPIAFHFQDPVKIMLDNWTQRQIITPVVVGEPVDWCTRMVVVTKKDGRPRLVADYQELNKNIKRETHHCPRPFDVVCGIPSHSYKTVLDAKDGYLQVKLDEESSLLTAFITIHGRYRYLRAPQGLKSSGDAYTRRFDEILVHIQDKVKIIDDSLLYDMNILQSFQHAYQFLQTCRVNDVTLNEKKFVFCQEDVEFAGFHLGWESYTPSSDITAAIAEFPMPERPGITDIRAWFGLVNQLAPFFATSKVMLPFRDLLQSGTRTVYWDATLQDIFERSKKEICEKAVRGLKYFNIGKNIGLQTDWSKNGIGFVLLQQSCSCESEIPNCCADGWRLVFCHSRFLQPSESNYCPLEGEALAVAWSLKKAKMFLLGCPGFVIQTDHKPLVPILGDKALSNIENPRLVRLKEKTLPYSFKIRHLSGDEMFAADALSRYPVGTPDSDDVELAEEAEVSCVKISAAIVQSDDVFSTTVKEIKKVAASDELADTISRNSFAATRNTENDVIKEFFNVRDRLSIVDNLITYTYETGAPRLVVPKTLRKRVIQNLHAAHQGVESILARARNSVYWPGITNDIMRSCTSCKDCKEIAPSLAKEPLILSGPPEYPFEKVAADMFSKNIASYMAFACRLTGWLEVAHFPQSTASKEIVQVFRDLFSRFGIPEEISLDGGKNLDSRETLNFLDSWGVSRRLSSAYLPQSNGRAEAAVKTARRILTSNTGPRGSLNTDAVSKALLQYRNTPLKGTTASPAQLLMGRSIRDSVPQPRSAYKVSAKWSQLLRQREKAMCRLNDTRTEDTVDRPSHGELAVGTEVVIQNADTKKWDRSGLVVESLPFRQYRVKLHGSGRMTLRNRIHLRPILVFKPATAMGVAGQHTGSSVYPNTPSAPIPSTASQSSPESSLSVPSDGPSMDSLVDGTSSSSSYRPTSTDCSSYRSALRSRSPLPNRRPVRKTTSPGRYGDWVKH